MRKDARDKKATNNEVTGHLRCSCFFLCFLSPPDCTSLDFSSIDVPTLPHVSCDASVGGLTWLLAYFQGIVCLIPSFILLGIAQSKVILWLGLILFSIGKRCPGAVAAVSSIDTFFLASSLVVNVINSFASKYGLSLDGSFITLSLSILSFKA